MFISYHHYNDQDYRNALVKMARQHELFVDKSVDTGDIDDSLPDERIREIIRDEYLRDSTVTIVLVGKDTKRRKHIDWEIYSSMFDGTINKKSGILVVNLPGISPHLTAPRRQERALVYPDIQGWITVDTRAEYERRYPYMPARIVDNLLKPEVKISVVPWERIADRPEKLKYLVDVTFADRARCRYDLSRSMRRTNS
ncbi:TIR domain-containing protein [Candidatus Palauibacter irciniicola]|uniref:TIR domain-containing protein n=1 Tax=Candidatus Palauibacter irciniicola TaxID=3056733 RepID=UPI003B02CAEE